MITTMTNKPTTNIAIILSAQSSITKKELSQIKEEQYFANITIIEQKAKYYDGSWEAIIETLKQEWHEYDGFLVIGAQHNIEYLATFIDLAIIDQDKPICITSEYPQTQDQEFHLLQHFGQQANIISAIQATTFNHAETVLVFGNVLLRATHAQRTEEETLNRFHLHLKSNLTPLGTIDFTIHFSEKYRQAPKNKQLNFKTTTQHNVMVVNLYPGMEQTLLDQIITTNSTQKIILTARNITEITPTLIGQLKSLTESGFTVVVYTEQEELPNLSPLILINNMTLPALYAKYMHFAQDDPSKDQDALRIYLTSEQKGEFLSSNI